MLRWLAAEKQILAGENLSPKLVILSKEEMRLVEAHLFATNSCLSLFITTCDYQLT